MAWTRFTPVVTQTTSARTSRDSWSMTASRLAPGEARRAVLDYAKMVDIPERLLDDVLLCVSEAVSNVVFHAYRDIDSDGTVEIEASVDRDLRICVRDQGSGFAMGSGSPGSGFGLPIINRLTRTFQISTMGDRGGTEVIMRFSLS